MRWMRQNVVARFTQLLKRWLCNVRSGTVVGKNCAPAADQCLLQASRFSVRLIGLLSVLLRCNSLPGVQRAVGDQTGSRPPNGAHGLGARVALGSALELLLHPTAELVATSGHVLLHVRIRLRNVFFGVL